MVLAVSTGNVADTGKPGLTSQQARVSSSGDSEVARVSSAVSQNVETRRVETRRAVEASAETQKPKPRSSEQRPQSLPPQLQAELNKSRDISFSDRKQSELSAKDLVKNLDQKKVSEQRAIEKAEQKAPEQAEKAAQEPPKEERRVKKQEQPEQNNQQNFVRLEAQRAYLDRVDAQRAYRKAAEREVELSSSRSKAAA
ncbi:MAG: hypothetical protein ACRBBN_07030 [Methyloligellaceae bacterium]